MVDMVPQVFSRVLADQSSAQDRVGLYRLGLIDIFLCQISPLTPRIMDTQ